MEINSGIYKIVNLINNKIYVGSAINFKYRKRNHFNMLKRNSHNNIHLQNSFNKYGKENFRFEIIEYVKDKDKLIEREQYWIDFYGIKNIYNICPIAGNTLGRKCSNETKIKIGKKSKGRKFSQESKNERRCRVKLLIKEGKMKGLFTKERTIGGKNPAAKKVICLETLEIFNTVKEAGKKYNRTGQAIGKNCMGKTKHCANLHWLYLSDYKDIK